MDPEKTVSITLHPAMLARAEELARRKNQTIDELFKDALLRYIVSENFRDDVLPRTRAKGKELGITTEADVERLSDEHRRDKRR